MENPVLRLRLEVNMSQSDFAAALGVSRATVQAAETGANHRPGRRLLDALERQGYNRQQILKEFEVWQEARRESAQKTLSARSGKGSR